MSLSMLSAVDFGSVLLNVLAIIGIIVAGGFLIFFLGDLLISIYDPDNSALVKSKRKEKNHEIEKLQEPARPRELTYAQQNFEDVDYNKALEEQKALEAGQQIQPETKPEQTQPIFYSEPVVKAEETQNVVEPEKVEEEKPATQSQEDIFAQLRAEEELFKQEKLKAATEHKNAFAEVESKKKEEEKSDDDFNFDDIFFSDDDAKSDETNEIPSEKLLKAQQGSQVLPENEEKVADETKEEENVTFDEEPKEEAEVVEQAKPEESNINLTITDNDKDLQDKTSEIDELKKANSELKVQLEELAKQKAAEAEKLDKANIELKDMAGKQTEKVTVTVPVVSEEELLARLDDLNERLKYNEKELRPIRKEYIPLRRIRKTLDSDKNKLRRREALVAKQKIIIYGVNNISDIDQDKAKHLQGDLDLLDGLRLSVQHCEEVIKNSEERYPVLETSFNVLTKNIEQIKKDIELTQSELLKIKK